jgi:hypothetical protein
MGKAAAAEAIADICKNDLRELRGIRPPFGILATPVFQAYPPLYDESDAGINLQLSITVIHIFYAIFRTPGKSRRRLSM